MAIATHRDRAAALCCDLGADGVEIAMDNCPHQVVVAVPSAVLPRLIERLRLESLLFEELPFSRAYHTPGFGPVVGPIAEFFAQMNFRRPSVPIYSCASGGRMPDSPEAIRELAVAQWTQTVAFRETIEAMHADGLRLFIDVGARGNLAGFVEDILRGKASFAVAANLPRVSAGRDPTEPSGRRHIRARSLPQHRLSLRDSTQRHRLERCLNQRRGPPSS